jgi:hypothetical protein
MPYYMIKRTDGGVIIMQTIPPATPEECIAKWPPDQQAIVQAIYPLDPSKVPTDRYFRNAWKPNNKNDGVEVHMPKARDIHRDVLRGMRKPKLQDADVEYIKADEKDDTPRRYAIRDYKQRLRDVPQDPAIDAAQTPEALKAVIPPALNEPIP